MCLNCQYDNFGCCKICGWKTCFDELFDNNEKYHKRMCDKCRRKHQKIEKWRQKIGICRTCKEVFNSRNKLFSHLKKENHFLN